MAIRNPRLRDADGTEYDPETGLRVGGVPAPPCPYDFWTCPLRSEGLRGDDNLFSSRQAFWDPETMSMLGIKILEGDNA